MRPDEAQALAADLKRLLGPNNVLAEPEDLICYGGDTTLHRGTPDAIARATEVEQVAALLAYCHDRGVPVIPRGSSTGISGGTAPIHGGVVLDLRSMNRILSIEPGNLSARAEAGVINRDFQMAVAKSGLFYPPDPSSMSVCTLGGNVAARAGGPRALKYGTTKDYVLGLTSVLPGGKVIRSGGLTSKNSTGYDLPRLLTGSEGTLAVITDVILRLIPVPRASRTLLVSFSELDQAARAVSAIIARSILPTALELMDQFACRCVEDFRPSGYPIDCDGVLLIELDGSEEEVERLLPEVEAACREEGAVSTRVAADAAQAAELWAGRRAIFPALIRRRPSAITEDATVPRTRIPDMVRAVRQIGADLGLTIPVVGHAGDGNLHPTMLCDPNDPEEMARVDEGARRIFRACLDLGGTLSGEHGIGLLKSRYLEWEAGPEGIELMKGIKVVFDPKGIMNPGKVWPWEAPGAGTGDRNE